MKAMILAAGRGERMRPLTDTVPKPLLEVGGKALIVHHVQRLVAAGITDLVVNHAHLGAMVEQALGDGHRFGARITYSPERPAALGTGGGVLNALPLMGDEPFIVVNGDIWTDYPFGRVQGVPDALAHLVLVENPSHNPAGDFSLSSGRAGTSQEPRFTFSGIGVYWPELFADCGPGAFPLGPLLRAAAARGDVTAELYRGRWFDVGTPLRLMAADRLARGLD